LVLLASECNLLLGLLQTGWRRRRTARATPVRLRVVPLGVLLRLLECLFSRDHRLFGSPLFGGQGCRHGLAQFRLPMEQVGGVMRTKGLCDIRQKTRGLVARRLDEMALEGSQGVLHARVPGVVLARLSSFLQEDRVAERCNRYQAKPPSKSCILGPRAILWRHVPSQAYRLLAAVGDNRCFHLPVDPLLCPIGGAHKPMKSSPLHEETDQPNATRPDCDTHHMERQSQAVEDGEARNALKELNPLRTGIEPILPRQPRVQRGTGHAQRLGRLTLGDPLGVQRAIPCKPVSTFAASPALIAIMIATVLVLDYRCHRFPPLPKPLPCAKWRAKESEVAP
jgi:hypothetical protein